MPTVITFIIGLILAGTYGIPGGLFFPIIATILVNVYTTELL